MEKICSYETLFAISGNCSEEEYVAIKEKFVNLVNDNATDVTVNEWGKRRLAYPINYKSIRSMCENLGINRKTVTMILKGEKKTNNYDYLFEYVEESEETIESVI